jgi:CopG family transcriptional regulator/antitoxin EndoAI
MRGLDPWVEEIMREEGRTKSELLREALRQYMQGQELSRLARYGQQRAKELGINPGDIERLVDEVRTEAEQQA